MENVLASRYASRPMVGLWTAEAKVVMERELWIAVMEAQRHLGVDIPDGPWSIRWTWRRSASGSGSPGMT